MKPITLHIFKTITYRIIGSFATSSAGFIISHQWKIAFAIGIADLVIKPGIYFLHERIWWKLTAKKIRS